MPADTRVWMEKARNMMLYGRGFVGVDIGSSSAKVVQLSVREGVPTVDSYGQISNSIYADSEDGQAAFPSAGHAGGEVSDLLHEAGILSRRGGISIPFSETLMQAVELPKRDPEQMKRIIPVESQKFIPVPINEILLDWYAIPDEDDSHAFETIKPHAQIETRLQQVMIVGINKKTAAKFLTISAQSGLASEFCEIEVFSALRASLHAKKAPTLVIDFGASGTKLYVVDQHWVMHAARISLVGGDAITREIKTKTGITYKEAEKLKRQHGLKNGPAAAAIETALLSLWNYTGQLLEEQEKSMHKKVEHVLIMGGGSFMPGILELVKDKLHLPTERLAGFSRTTGPMILEDTFKEDGPLYAVAVGLALRGLGM